MFETFRCLICLKEVQTIRFRTRLWVDMYVIFCMVTPSVLIIDQCLSVHNHCLSQYTVVSSCNPCVAGHIDCLACCAVCFFFEFALGDPPRFQSGRLNLLLRTKHD
jgi:hypothetical protein